MINIEELVDVCDNYKSEGLDLAVYLYVTLGEMIRDSLEEPRYKNLCMKNKKDRAKFLRYILPISPKSKKIHKP